MEIKQATLIRGEFLNAIRMIRLGADLKYYIQTEQNMIPKERMAHLKQMNDRCQEVNTEYEKLWLIRNKSGGLETSMKALVNLNAQIEKEIKIQEKGAMARRFHRFIEKAIVAAIVLFIS